MSGKNVVILTIECLRKEAMGPYYRSMEEITPVMSALAGESKVMQRYHSPSSWTLPSFFSIFTSRYSLENKGRIDLNGSEKTFVEILKENGYHTLGITGGGWLSSFFGFEKGYDKFHDGLGGSSSFMKKVQKMVMMNDHLKTPASYLHFLKAHYFPGRRIGDNQTTIAKDWISKRPKDKPYFLWIHYIETHDPYYPNRNMTDVGFNRIWEINKKIKENMARRGPGEVVLTPEEEDLLWEIYRLELTYVDGKIGELLEHMRKTGSLDEDTVVFMLGDHGQQFMEHGDFGHSIELYQELVNTPMIIYNPKSKGEVSDSLISGLDIGPTVLELAGIKTPKEYLGKPFLGDKAVPAKEIILMEGQERRDDFIIKNNTVSLDERRFKFALIQDRMKLIFRWNGSHSLFDLKKDPKERENLFDEGRKDVMKMVARVKEVHANIKSSGHRFKLKGAIKKIKFNKP